MSAHGAKSTTFPLGGVHPNEHKELTQNLPIEVMPCPLEINVFIKQHVGPACEPTVAPKDKVTFGQVIGTVGDKLGASIHASVSGTVRAVKEVPHSAIARDTAVIITADKEADAADYSKEKPQPENWKALPREEILKRMKDAGLVGLGGAGFPIYAKVSLKPDVKVDTLILNGAECEPYITCDHRVMLEYAAEIVEGAKILMTIIGNKKCVIGVEANKTDAAAALNKAIDSAADKADWDVSVKVLQVKYPQGAADQIMESVTGRVRPAGVRSSTIGIIVQNVYSAQRPCTTRWCSKSRSPNA
jgi:electron transport complex protein RnfC